MALTPGSRVGVYEIRGLLGVGGMGEVYRAHDERLKRDVAIKVLPALVATDPERLERFQREAQALAALNHPHIAQVFGLETTSGVVSGKTTPDVVSYAIVMELVDGPTLAEVIAGGGHSAPAITVADALPIARQIADALEAAAFRSPLKKLPADCLPGAANIATRAHVPLVSD